MSNTKINFKWNDCEDLDSIITDGIYDLGDWLSDNGVKHEYDNNTETYYVLDEFGKRTGETYFVINTEPTEEDLRG